jgi:hypothetical protein
MLISVVNHTNGKLKDEQVQDGIRAVNRQITHDFKPHWHLNAELRLEGSIGDDPDKDRLPELRGDAIIYLWDELDVDGALGYHEANAAGVPFGFVFTELVKELGEPWTVTLSHEALELIADPEVNLLVAGPHPGDPEVEVFHWYEMCDAVQNETYKVDGIAVSNFLLPFYFTADPEAGGRNDFLGRRLKGQMLQSFGINPGGYIGFYNPGTQEDETFSLKGDRRAKERMEIKGKARLTRRSTRYKMGTAYAEMIETEMARGAPRAARSARRRATAVLAAAPPHKPGRRALAVQMLDSSRGRKGMR